MCIIAPSLLEADYKCLGEQLKTMEKSGADILKMAVMPHGFEDVAAIMEATNAMRKECEKPLVSMAMGSIGSISRIPGKTSAPELPLER